MVKIGVAEKLFTLDKDGEVTESACACSYFSS